MSLEDRKSAKSADSQRRRRRCSDAMDEFLAAAAAAAHLESIEPISLTPEEEKVLDQNALESLERFEVVADCELEGIVPEQNASVDSSDAVPGEEQESPSRLADDDVTSDSAKDSIVDGSEEAWSWRP